MVRVGIGVQRVASWLTATTMASGCIAVRANGDYVSSVSHESMALETSVAVVLDPKLTDDEDDDTRARLERIRATFANALGVDLGKNGPLVPQSNDPQARLEVRMLRAEDRAFPWSAFWFFAPAWLFGVPLRQVTVEVDVETRLLAATGEALFSLPIEARCDRYQGIYYGHQDLTYGCAFQKITETLRSQINSRRVEILSAYERSSHRRDRRFARRNRSEASPPPVPASRTLRGPRPVAAVFEIRDMSGRLEPATLDQLTEFLAARITERLGFRVVPRDQLRSELVAKKSESYRPCVDDSCQLELGKAVAANKSISTTLIRVGQRCALSSTVYDLVSEAAERAATTTVPCRDDALLDGVVQLVDALSKASR